MSKRDDGGPAFPAKVKGTRTEPIDGTWSRIFEVDVPVPGMSLRDWFAGHAMQGMMASWGEHDVTDYGHIASDSYQLADAMIAERQKGDTTA